MGQKLENLQKRLAEAKASRRRGRWTVKFLGRTVVEGMVYGGTDSAGFDKVLYDKILALGRGVDYLDYLEGLIVRCQRAARQAKVEAQPAYPVKADVMPPGSFFSDDEDDEDEMPPPDSPKPKTLDVPSPR